MLMVRIEKIGVAFLASIPWWAQSDRGSVIGVKAAVAHRQAYDPIAARMFWVDTPGPCRSNLKTLPFRRVSRPIYPLDETV